MRFACPATVSPWSSSRRGWNAGQGWLVLLQRSSAGVSKARGHGGQLLQHWKPDVAIIPPGFVYVGSSHPSGFDSRYFGLVSMDRLHRMEKVL
jgi:type IV secretory pathway protease TraF